MTGEQLVIPILAADRQPTPAAEETLVAATQHRPVQVTAAGMRQQVCGHPADTEYADDDGRCRAQRLSRPDGRSWRECWLCKTTAAPKGVVR